MARAEMAQVGAKEDHSAQELMDRGAQGPLSAIGVALKGLIKRGLVEMSQPARRKGNRKARYTLTRKGLAKVRHSI